MRVTKAGIKVYEEGDPLDGSSPILRLGDAVNKLRIEINTMADVIDQIMEEVGILESKTGVKSGEQAHRRAREL